MKSTKVYYIGQLVDETIELVGASTLHPICFTSKRDAQGALKLLNELHPTEFANFVVYSYRIVHKI